MKGFTIGLFETEVKDNLLWKGISVLKIWMWSWEIKVEGIWDNDIRENYIAGS